MKMEWHLISDDSEVRRHQRSIKKLIPEAEPGKRFEHEFGLFMIDLKPEILSTKPFKIPLHGKAKYEIDVFAKFPEVVVVTECKEGEAHNIPKDVAAVAQNAGEVANAIRKHIPGTKGANFVCALAYSDKIPKQVHFETATKAGVVLVDRKILDAYLEWAKKLKESARDIIFADWLKGKDIKSLPSKEKIILATKGEFEEEECYSFMASPYLLKKLCYVQRRHVQHTHGEQKVSYQRLIKPEKIKSIRTFLEEGNFFPSSVLINFEEGIEFSPIEMKPAQMKSANPNISHGWLKPRKKHGCAIVIDGQHRIFGYSGLDDLSKEHSMNVIAFSDLDSEAQAELFAEINENQTPINKDVLWDLYENILKDTNPKYKVSTLVKQLNLNSTFFKDKIFIPSISRRPKKHYPLHMNSVCRPLAAQKSVFNLLLGYDRDRYNTVVDLFFTNLIEDSELKEDWERKEKSFTLSNNGFEIMAMVLNYFHEYLLKNGVDTKNISIKGLMDWCNEFSAIICKALKGLGLDNLRKSLGYSAAKAKQGTRDNILIEGGKHSDVFKKISRKVYLQGLREDMETEWKETLYFDKKKGEYSDEYFNDAILGTITAFINSSVKGDLYVGVTDDGKIVGLKNELEEKFKNNLDEMTKFIGSKLTSGMMTKEFNKHSIKIDPFLDDPLVLKIHVPGDEKGVSLVTFTDAKGNKKWLPFMKTSYGKRKIKDFKAALGDDKTSLMKDLIIEYMSPED